MTDQIDLNQLEISGETPKASTPLTKDNWLEYWINGICGNPSFFLGHLEGSERVTNGLEKIVLKAQTFDELKSELLTFIQDRRDFDRDVQEKWYGDTPEKWGFLSP